MKFIPIYWHLINLTVIIFIEKIICRLTDKQTNIAHVLVRISHARLFLLPRFAERSSLLVGHPAVALCRLHAQMWEWSGGAAQPEPVPGYTSAVQHRGPGEGLAQLPQMRQIPCGMFGRLHCYVNVVRYFIDPRGQTSLFTAGQRSGSVRAQRPCTV